MKGPWGWIHIKLRELCKCGAPMEKAIRTTRFGKFQSGKPRCSDWERHYEYEQTKKAEEA